APVVGLAFAHQNPAAVAAPLNVRARRSLVMGHAFSDPVLDPALGILDISALGGAPYNVFETHAGRYLYAAIGIEESLVFAVAQDEVILAIVERERFGDAFNRDRQSQAAFTNLSLVCLLELDRRVTEDTERLGHPADLVAAIATGHVDRCVSGRYPAHLDSNSLEWPHHLRDHIPHCNQDGPRQARSCD